MILILALYGTYSAGSHFSHLSAGKSLVPDNRVYLVSNQYSFQVPFCLPLHPLPNALLCHCGQYKYRVTQQWLRSQEFDKASRLTMIDVLHNSTDVGILC